MSHREPIQHEFVKFIPDSLEPGVLYISIPYATTTHLCMSGCGQEVVLPLSPQQWKLTFDGQTASLSPSVGNWSFECQSHYWIERDAIRWAGQISKEAIAATREARATSIRSAVRVQKRSKAGTWVRDLVGRLWPR